MKRKGLRFSCGSRALFMGPTCGSCALSKLTLMLLSKLTHVGPVNSARGPAKKAQTRKIIHSAAIQTHT